MAGGAPEAQAPTAGPFIVSHPAASLRYLSSVPEPRTALAYLNLYLPTGAWCGCAHTSIFPRPVAWPSQHSTVLHPEGGLPTFFFLQGHSLGVVTSPWPWLGPPWPRGILGLGRLCRLSGHLMAHMAVLLPPAWSKSFTVGDGCVEGGGCPATVSIATLHALGRGCSPPLWAEVKVGSPTARR